MFCSCLCLWSREPPLALPGGWAVAAMGGWSWGSRLVKAREGPFSLVPGELRAPGQEERVRVDLQDTAEQDQHPWGAAFLRRSLPTLVREGEGSWGGADS